jgi:pyridoxamine 5'-phosphate oxidase
MDPDPFAQFSQWFAGVLEAGIDEPNAFVIATADTHGRPSARAVLMKEFGEQGLVFYTGLRSRKSLDIERNPHGAATFVWTPLHRQVRFEGQIVAVPAATADEYFATRPRGAQVAAHASEQSRAVASREFLERRFAELDTEFDGQPIPRPDNWGGWRLAPETVEFWQGRPNRFHDRILYRHDGEGWSMQRLAP